MRYALSVLGVAAALAVAGCEQPPSEHNQRQSPRESAKQVDADEPPLLLEDAPVGAASGPAASPSGGGGRGARRPAYKRPSPPVA